MLPGCCAMKNPLVFALLSNFSFALTNADAVSITTTTSSTTSTHLYARRPARVAPWSSPETATIPTVLRHRSVAFAFRRPWPTVRVPVTVTNPSLPIATSGRTSWTAVRALRGGGSGQSREVLLPTSATSTDGNIQKREHVEPVQETARGGTSTDGVSDNNLLREAVGQEENEIIPAPQVPTAVPAKPGGREEEGLRMALLHAQGPSK